MKHVEAPLGLNRDGTTNDGRLTVTLEEYAALSGMSLSSVRRHVREGGVRCVQPGGKNGRLLIPVQAVLEEFGIAPSLNGEAAR